MFEALPGVTDVTVGYAGGFEEWPTYKSIKDHTEALRIEFDPTVISYDKILESFFEQTDMTYMPYSNQYRNALLVHNPEQRAIAQELFIAQCQQGKGPYLKIEDATTFYRAEEYHQKFLAKQTRTMVPASALTADYRPAIFPK